MTDRPDPTPDVEPMLDRIRDEFDPGWSDDDLDRIREQLVQIVRRGEALRAVPLTPGDEPGTVFVPRRAEP